MQTVLPSLSNLLAPVFCAENQMEMKAMIGRRHEPSQSLLASLPGCGALFVPIPVVRCATTGYPLGTLPGSNRNVGEHSFKQKGASQEL